MLHDYYQDAKYCRGCRSYVRYLRAVERSYCVVCGMEVQLFSDDDAKRFRALLVREKRVFDAAGGDGAAPGDVERVGA